MEFQIAAMVLVFARSGYLHYYYHLFAILITDNVSFICVLSSAIHNTRVLQFTSLVFFLACAPFSKRISNASHLDELHRLVFPYHQFVNLITDNVPVIVCVLLSAIYDTRVL